ncbi:MAG: glycosyltransferase 87 family protein [Planctomycetota bacterium]
MPDSPASTLDRKPFAPTARALVFIAALDLLVRCIYARGWLTLSGDGLATYTAHGDGYSYLNYARFIAGDLGELSAYDRRVFPGLPMILGGLRLVGLPVEVAGVAVALASSLAASVLTAVLFRDVRAGWLMAITPPTFVACSAMVGNETPMLAALLGGMILLRRDRTAAVVFGGLLLGVAGAIRPMACFGAGAFLLWLLLHKRWWHAGIAGVLAAAVVGAALGAVAIWFGDALEGAKEYANNPKAYDGQIFAWPLQSILETPAAQNVPLSKTAYVWAYVLTLAAAIGVLAWKLLRPGQTSRAMLLMAMAWLLGNTGFALCVGSDWGFYIFPRLLLPGLPPMIWAAVLAWPKLLKGKLSVVFLSLFAIACLGVALFEGRPQ